MGFMNTDDLKRVQANILFEVIDGNINTYIGLVGIIQGVIEIVPLEQQKILLDTSKSLMHDISKAQELRAKVKRSV